MAVCALLALLGQRQVNAERKVYLAGAEERPFVPPLPEVVKLLTLGYTNLAADWFWIETIQYYENCSDHKRFPKDLYTMADFITDLDPHYCLAYFYASLSLIQNVGERGQIIALLEKGSREDACPDYWRNPFLLGYYYAFELREYKNAAPWMRKACELQKMGLKSICGLASRLEAVSGEPEDGIVLLQDVIKAKAAPEDEFYFQNRLLQLEAKIVERDLTGGIKRYEQLHGAPPAELADVFKDGPVIGTPPAGYLPIRYTAVLPHPLEGHAFVYDREKDQVRTDPPMDLDKVHFSINTWGKRTPKDDRNE